MFRPGLGGQVRAARCRANGRLSSILRSAAVAAIGLALAGGLFATTFTPIPDRELYRRADVVVRGIVMSSEGAVSPEHGWPETVTVVHPLAVWKGSLSGDLVLHQAGGMLRDGRFFQLWGRPEYAPGEEIVVFAIARPEGDFQTAEMLLGKFSVSSDDAGRLFAAPALAIGEHPGVSVIRVPPDRPAIDGGMPALSLPPSDAGSAPDLGDSASDDGPRELTRFLDFLDAGGRGLSSSGVTPVGALTPVLHPTASKGLVPEWGNLNGSLWRYNNNATAAWTYDGTANMTGGGTTEATNALATWTNDSSSTINYTHNQSASNPIHLTATSSPCGWSTCIDSSGGVIGCGGPNGGGSNTWRGDGYNTITGGEVWLRCYASLNAWGSVTTQSVLTHELGHTLGLGHSDQNTSPHDTCRGDESLAIMRSVAQNRTTLGTDDQDAIRWIYGDGGNHCTVPGAPPTAAAFAPGSGSPNGNTTFTLTGTNFQSGATVKLGGTAAIVTNVASTTITGKTANHAVGSVEVIVTNTDSQSAMLPNAFFYDFLDVPPSYMFHAAVLKIYKNGITTGCGGNNFCPDVAVTRDQMAVFVLRGMHGSSYMPPTATGTLFTDVTTQTPFAAWMEEFWQEGIIDECAQLPLRYCPSNTVSRAEMAMLLLRGKHGSSYTPPAATGVFLDVPKTDPYAGWIEELYKEGITSGCGGGNYCPGSPNTRGEMAVFLSRTFSLP